MATPTIAFNDKPPVPVDANALLQSFRAKKDHDKLVTWANSQYDMVKQARAAIERQWYLNLSFYFGKQYVGWTNVGSAAQGIGGQRLYTPQAPPWRVRMVANKVRPIIRTELAKITAQRPSAIIYPASSDDQDIFAARAGEQIFESIYRQKKLRAVGRKSFFWTLICGTGYMKDWWDPTAIDNNSPDTPGDIKIEAETPFHIMVPDFMEEEIENQPWLIHASTKSPEWVRANYGKILKDNSINPNTHGAQDILAPSFLNLVGTDQLTKNQVMCMEVWIKPGAHQLFPQGGMFTILGDQIVQISGLEQEPWPFKHNEYPITKFNHIPTGKYYSDSAITDLIPLQKEYNRTRSQIIEAKNRMAKPQLMAFKGSINPAQMTTEPGQVILVTPGFAMPTPVPLQPLPAYVVEELNRCTADMDDISGQHEITKGRVPPGVTAATAISYLQEQDDSKISHTVDSIEDGMEKIAQHCLSHVVQFWDEPRLIKVTGEDGAYDAITLKGADLRGNTDIRVEAGSALPTSKAAKQAYVMDLMKMGFVTPDQGLKVLEFGGLDKLYNDMQIDVRQAQRENLRMQKPDPQLVVQQAMQQAMTAVAAPQIDPTTGQPMPPQAPQPTLQVPVNDWDNHAVHIDTHDKFRKSAAFEQLDDSIKQQFQLHVDNHKQLMQQAQMQQQMGQMPAQAPNAGVPSTPGVDPAQEQQIAGQLPPQLGGQ